MGHLKQIKFQKDDLQGFPYELPFFDVDIDFNHPITILTGDNGCGKTTLLELIQEQLGLFQIGQPLNPMHHDNAKISFDLKKPKGFYFSSEDFTTYIYELEKEKVFAKQSMKQVEGEYKDKSAFARQQAKGPYAKTIAEIDRLHDRNLLKSSHGESYLSFFKSRLRPNYLILLDEPETPLSFSNQLSLLYLLHQAIEENCQLIIATHSPLIMAYPNANILKIDQEGIQKIQYEDIENVKMMKDFLNHPERYFNHLFRS